MFVILPFIARSQSCWSLAQLWWSIGDNKLRKVSWRADEKVSSLKRMQLANEQFSLWNYQFQISQWTNEVRPAKRLQMIWANIGLAFVSPESCNHFSDENWLIILVHFFFSVDLHQEKVSTRSAALEERVFQVMRGDAWHMLSICFKEPPGQNYEAERFRKWKALKLKIPHSDQFEVQIWTNQMRSLLITKFR